jgi:hypothetical protein
MPRKRYRFFWLDAKIEKVRASGRVVGRALVRELVHAAPHTIETRCLAVRVVGQRTVYRLAEKGLSEELLCSQVDLSGAHRSVFTLEHNSDRLEDGAWTSQSRSRFQRVCTCFSEQALLDIAQPRELSRCSGVGKCPV